MSAQEGDDLLYVCQDGEFDRAVSLVSSGTSVDFQDEETGYTPAMSCCFDDYPTILQYLIDQGAELNRADNNGATAVFIAAQYNSHQCTALHPTTIGQPRIANHAAYQKLKEHQRENRGHRDHLQNRTPRRPSRS